MNVTAPQFYDFWREVFESVTFSIQDLQSLRGVSRAIRCISDAHATVHGDNDEHSTARYLRLPADDRPKHVSLTTLRFSAYIYQPLPPSVTSLTVGNRTCIGRLTRSMLPRNLRTLALVPDTSIYVYSNDLPSTLTSLTLSDHHVPWLRIVDLPRSLTHLSLGRSSVLRIDVDHLPRGLLALLAGGSLLDNTGSRTLPPVLKTLEGGTLLRAPFDGRDLPQALERLVIRFQPDVFDAARLPRSLTELELVGSFDRRLNARDLPETLRHLRFGDSFDQPVNVAGIPRRLVSLRFGKTFDQRIDTWQLPRTLTALRLGAGFRGVLDAWGMPPLVEFVRDPPPT